MSLVLRKYSRNVKSEHFIVFYVQFASSLFTDGNIAYRLVELNIAWTLLKSAGIKTVCQYVPKDIQKINLSGCLKEITDARKYLFFIQVRFFIF